jgi:type II secretory ATPase GspE/PulE/Tfp pilus assembly ATPase PilB-like protein
MVFSTLHTNNAATCLPRLLDMGIEPFLIASTVRAVIGQRLVRRLCPDCREDYAPDDGILDQITKIFHLKEAGVMKRVHDLEAEALAGGIGEKNPSKLNKRSTSELGSTDKSVVKLWKAHEDGCDNCNHSGYRGRMGIYEVLTNNEAVQKLIVNNTTSEELQRQAVADGMVTMQLDGFIKALRGQTTIEEILRVTSET